MSPFQTLIRSRDSPLNIQTLTIVLIDAIMPMPELTNSYMENVPCTSKTRKILLLIMYVVFLKITTFLWRILILAPGHTSLFLETVTIKFMGPWAEKNKYPFFDLQQYVLFILLKRSISAWIYFSLFYVTVYCKKWTDLLKSFLEIFTGPEYFFYHF